MKIIDEASVLELVQMKFNKDRATVKFRPDIDNTFVAYQVIFKKHEIWINARTAEISGGVFCRPLDYFNLSHEDY